MAHAEGDHSASRTRVEGATMQSRDLVVGVFDRPEDAEGAINGLKDAGFGSDDIGVAARTREEADALTADGGVVVGSDTVAGMYAGGLLGGVAGWLAGLTTLAVPGVGALLAAGPLVAAVSGAGVGAAAGGLLGALAEAGIPREEAGWYDEQLRGGGILLTVRAGERYDEAQAIMRRHRGHDFSTGRA
jgi:hypothetical protein